MKLGFLYAGQGSQHPGMGADLYETFPAFRTVIDSAQVDFDLKEVSFQDALGVREGDLLQIKIHAVRRPVENRAEGGKRLVQVRAHARVLAALSGVKKTELHHAALHSFMIWSICSRTVERRFTSPALAPQKNRPFSHSPFRAAMRALEMQ